MQRLNEQMVLHKIWEHMDDLKNGNVKGEVAIAFSKNADKIVRLYENELRRANIELKAAEVQKETGKLIKIRNLSTMSFEESTAIINGESNGK